MKTFLNGRLIDGTGRVMERSMIVIGDSKFVRIGSPEKGTQLGGEVFDIQGMTVMPGLIDCHVHLSISGEADPFSTLPHLPLPLLALKFLRNAQTTLLSGITTIRDQGAIGHVDFSVRRAAEEKLFTLPRMVLSGKAITITGGHGWQFGAREADGPDEVRKAVREQIKAGANSIKMIASGGGLTEGSEPGSVAFSAEELKAAVEEAHKAGKRTSAHAHAATSIKYATQAGIDSIEHAMFMDQEALEMMEEYKVFYVPTVVAPLRALEDSAGKVPQWLIKKVEGFKGRFENSVKMAHKGNLKIAMGSDAGTPLNPHGENSKELEHFVKLGFSPMEAILAGTKIASEVLGFEKEIGTIEEGKIADLIVVDGNPLEDITCLQRKEKIVYIVKDGEMIKGPGVNLSK
jgi:imidazolonepropionase-like amidohydrolase